MAGKRRPYLLPDPLTCSPEKIKNGISMPLVEEYIRKHEARLPRYNYLENLYKGFHDIYKQPEKEEWKPDWRLVVNFPWYITNIFMGYGYGIPIKTTHPDDNVMEAISTFEKNNEIADHDYELFKKACIFGHSWEYFYQDENARTKVAICSPKELFVVYDDTMKSRALFAVRYGHHGMDSDYPGEKFGEVLTKGLIEPFDCGVKKDPYENPYGYIPCVEYRLNEERIGLFEETSGLTEVFNHTIGEKANDVDAFADAYLAVLGCELSDDGYYKLRDKRLINLYGTENAKDILVQFLQKPTADGTQENLLNRLERLIFHISMVANISDENFGSSSSGVSLSYKLLAMGNMASGFDRKIKKSIKKRYKIFCSLSTNVSDKNAWTGIEIKTTRNVPKNILEEAQTAQALEGTVSKETQLSVLSIVNSATDEIKKMEDEQKKLLDDMVTRRMFGADADEE